MELELSPFSSPNIRGVGFGVNAANVLEDGVNQSGASRVVVLAKMADALVDKRMDAAVMHQSDPNWHDAWSQFSTIQMAVELVLVSRMETFAKHGVNVRSGL